MARIHGTLRWVCMVVAGLGLLGSRASGVVTRTWTLNDEKSFREGQLTGVTLSDKGALSLAPDLGEISKLPDAVAWSVAEVSDGVVWVGTGHFGRIFSVAQGKEPVEVAKLDDLEVLSLLPDGKGGAWAGTGPKGLILKVSRDGDIATVFDAPESYVWDLAQLGNDLYAAVGPGAKIYKVSPKGEATPVYASQETHVLSLSPQADGTFLVGTEGKGLALSVRPSGEVRVIYDPPENEVRGVLATPKGTFFIGFSGQSAQPKPPEEKAKEAGQENQEGKVEEKTELLTPRGKGNLYWKSLDGEVRPLFEASGLLCLCMPAGNEEWAWVGTGDRGRIYRAMPGGRWEIGSELGSASVLRGVPKASKGLYLVASNPSALYLASGGTVSKGTYTTPALDAGMFSDWGSIEARAELPKGASIGLATRSGDTQVPDDTWSPWSASQSFLELGRVQSPAGRFLQVRVDLASNNDRESPRVQELRLAYVQSNVAPRILDLTSSKAAENKDNKDSARKAEIPSGWDALSGQVSLTWKASDDNGDKLTFTLYYLRQGDGQWWPLAKDLEGESWGWDTTSWQDGRYSLRIEGSDEPENGPALAKRGEKTIPLIVVDNTAPGFEELKVVSSAAGFAVKGQAQDALSHISGLEWSLDAQKWRKALPADRLFDHSSEAFEIPLGDLSAGEHTVAVRSTDAAGNSRVERLVFQK